MPNMNGLELPNTEQQTPPATAIEENIIQTINRGTEIPAPIEATIETKAFLYTSLEDKQKASTTVTKEEFEKGQKSSNDMYRIGQTSNGEEIWLNKIQSYKNTVDHAREGKVDTLSVTESMVLANPRLGSERRTSVISIGTGNDVKVNSMMARLENIKDCDYSLKIDNPAQSLNNATKKILGAYKSEEALPQLFKRVINREDQVIEIYYEDSRGKADSSILLKYSGQDIGRIKVEAAAIRVNLPNGKFKDFYVDLNSAESVTTIIGCLQKRKVEDDSNINVTRTTRDNRSRTIRHPSKLEHGIVRNFETLESQEDRQKSIEITDKLRSVGIESLTPQELADANRIAGFETQTTAQNVPEVVGAEVTRAPEKLSFKDIEKMYSLVESKVLNVAEENALIGNPQDKNSKLLGKIATAKRYLSLALLYPEESDFNFRKKTLADFLGVAPEEVQDIVDLVVEARGMMEKSGPRIKALVLVENTLASVVSGRVDIFNNTGLQSYVTQLTEIRRELKSGRFVSRERIRQAIQSSSEVRKYFNRST